MRSICVRTASTVVPAGSSPTMSFAPLTSGASASSLSTTPARSAAAPFFELLLELLDLLLKRLDAGRQFLRRGTGTCAVRSSTTALRLLHRRRRRLGR